MKIMIETYDKNGEVNIEVHEITKMQLAHYAKLAAMAGLQLRKNHRNTYRIFFNPPAEPPDYDP